MVHNHIIQVIPETVLQAQNAFISVIKSRRRSRSTIHNYEYCLTVLRKNINTKIMLEITSDDLREFFTSLQDDHSIGGVEVFYRAIRAFWKWYWDEYDIERRNPISRVKVAHQPAIPRAGIPLEDFQLLFDSCKSVRDKAILYALLDTCARATEFCSMRVKDIDLTTGQITIRNGKGNKERIVRLGNRSMRMMRKYLKSRGMLRENDPLFASRTDEFLDRFSLRLLIDRRADDVGIKHYGIHDFRRRGAYEMWKVTRDLKGVSLYLGHSDVSVTRRYINVEDDDIMETHITGGPVDNL
jgi:site-specific recombinase XerD